MDIKKLSKEERMAIVELSADDLVMICNALYGQYEEKKDNENFSRLYSDMMIARDLCQYGHIDNFCLSRINKSRNAVENELVEVLTDDEIDVFNAYLEDGDMKTVFKNTDWLNIYKKIVGNRGLARCDEKLKSWMMIDS